MENNFFWILAVDAVSVSALILIFILCFKIKDLTLRVIAFIFIYPLIHLLYLKNGGVGIRIVGVTGLPLYSQYLDVAYWTYFASCAVFYIFLGRARKEEFSVKAEIRTSAFSFWVVFAFFVLVAVLAHPWVFGLSGRREQIFLSGAWNALYVSTFLVLCVFRVKGGKYNTLAICAVPLFLMLNGERANSILMLGAVYLFYIHRSRVNVGGMVRNKAAVYVALIVTVVAALLAGQIREVTYSSEVESFGVFKVFNYTTAIEALHVYLASFWYVDNYGHDLRAIAGALYSFVPLHPLGGAGSPYFFEKIILDKVQTVGGGIFIAEGVLLAGPIGAVIMSAVFGCVLRYVFLSKNKWLGVLYMLFFVLAFRVVWYGWEYIIPSMYTLAASIYFLRLVGKVR